MVPYLLYYILIFCVYPVKNYTGEPVCHLMNFCRNCGIMMVQSQSFFMSVFRYTCLFHDNFLLKTNLSPFVSALKYLMKLLFQKQVFIQFVKNLTLIYFPFFTRNTLFLQIVFLFAVQRFLLVESESLNI